MKEDWKTDLNKYIVFMGDSISVVHVTPRQARELLGVKRNEQMPERPWRYMGKELRIHKE